MAIYYIDPVNGNDSNNGTSESSAWKTISKSNNFSHQPGDIIEFIGNSVLTGANDYIHPKNSGVKGNPITYRCRNGETTTIATNNYRGGGFFLNTDINYSTYDTKNYITISGFKIITSTWGRIDATTGVIIENLYCGHKYEIDSSIVETYGDGYANVYGIRMRHTKYATIKNNIFNGCQIGSSQDVLQLSGKAHHNLIENNHFKNAGHLPISIEGNNVDYKIEPLENDSRFNIIKNNYFFNEFHQGPVGNVGGHHLVYENNILTRAGTGTKEGERYKYLVMDGIGNELGSFSYAAGINGIIRNNIIMKSGASQWWQDNADTWYTFGTVDNKSGVASAGNRYEANIATAENRRIFNNVFYKNYGTVYGGGNGHSSTPPSLVTSDNYPLYKNHIIKNNIFYKNGEMDENYPGTSWNKNKFEDMFIYYTNSSLVSNSQNLFNDKWLNNLMEDSNNNKILLYGRWDTGHYYNLNEMQSGQVSELPSTTFQNNIQNDPLFVNASTETTTNDLDLIRNNFALSNGSPCIESGDFLTTATNSGNNSTTLVVDDPYYFIGGETPSGIVSDLGWDNIVPGDTIQVGNTIVQIKNINYNTKTIELMNPISWSIGTGIAFPFEGSKPSMGLYTVESGTPPVSSDFLVSNTDTNADFKNITEVNAYNFEIGNVVSFKSGETFSDAMLVCKEGVTYKSSGNEKAIIGNFNNSFDYTISVGDNNDVKISNLKVLACNDSNGVISFGLAENLEVSDCEIIGNDNSHDVGTFGTYNTTAGTSSKAIIGHKYLRNKIHDLGYGIYLTRPYNVEIAYNELYDFYRLLSTVNVGGNAIRLGGTKNGDTWDCEYTFNIHHNNIYNFEYNAFSAGLSNMIIEYNEIHHALDERIYRGGAKHGGIGKLWDDTDRTIGGIGLIFRYNYVHDLTKYGEDFKTYEPQTKVRTLAKTFVEESEYNGGSAGKPSYGLPYEHPNHGWYYGDDVGPSPDFAVHYENQDSVMSGGGYSHCFIHNNIFKDISKSVWGQGEAVKGIYEEQYRSYFINNTIINCGNRKTFTDYSSCMHTEYDSEHPVTVANNIIDYNPPTIRYSATFKAKNTHLHNNVYPRSSGVATTSVTDGSNIATYVPNSGLVVSEEKYETIPEYSNINSTFFASNIGPNGVNIPDVRILKNGNLNKTGYNYININGGVDGEGRSFAYDILTNLRTDSDIGALSVAGSIVIPPSDKIIKTLVVTQLGTTEILIAPTIRNQTVGPVLLNEGTDLQLSITAEGTLPLSYQWYKNDIIINGSTNNIFTISRVTEEDSGLYKCIVSNGIEPDAVSNNIFVDVVGQNVAPVIVKQPANQKVAVNGTSETAYFDVDAIGGSISFQWYKNDVAIPGATSKIYIFRNATPSDDGTKFNVVVSNNVGSDTSDDVFLNVYKVSSILKPIVLKRVIGGERSVRIQWIEPNSIAGLNYEIWSNNTGLNGEYIKRTDLINPITKEYVDNEFEGYGVTRWYYINTYNPNTGELSKKSEKISGTTTYLGTLKITKQPTSQYVSIGGSVTFEILATGGTNLLYQWLLNGNDLQDERSNILTLNNINLDNDGDSVRCRITNDQGQTILSDIATITVSDLIPIINIQPSNITISTGQTARFEIDASNVDNYQWQEYLLRDLVYEWRDVLDGSNVSGTNTNTLTLTDLNAAVTRKFRCKLSNELNQSIYSNQVELKVVLDISAPTITTQPTPKTVIEGNDITFEVVANGALPLTYQWYEITEDVVGVAPTINQQPQNKTITENENVSFTINATGTEPLTYQWYEIKLDFDDSFPQIL